MQTLLDASDTEAEWLVKLTAGLPGGIGNTGAECGGVTAPLVLIGLRHARDPMHDGLPPVIDKGHDLLQRFAGCHGTTLCREIRGTDRLPLRCVGAVRQAPELCAQTLSSDCAHVIPAASRDAYRRLYAHFVEKEFHCAHAVVQQVRHTNPVSQDVLDATSPFIGGTVLTGMTCSALTAGVMALGVALGEIERSRLRVLRMIGTMAAGGDAFADDVNKFNRTMNLGHQLAKWFTGAFGSTQCRDITGCDFSTTVGSEPVHRHRRRGTVSGDRAPGRSQSGAHDPWVANGFGGPRLRDTSQESSGARYEDECSRCRELAGAVAPAGAGAYMRRRVIIGVRVDLAPREPTAN